MFFLLIFNDITDVICHSNFADDAVLQVAGKDVHIISIKLTVDLKNLSEWLTTNKLMIENRKHFIWNTAKMFEKPLSFFSFIQCYSCCKNIELCVSRRKN